jgi:hypothetical protein
MPEEQETERVHRGRFILWHVVALVLIVVAYHVAVFFFYEASRGSNRFELERIADVF